MLRSSILSRIDRAGWRLRTVVRFRFAYTLAVRRQAHAHSQKPPRQCFSGVRTIEQLSNMDEFS